MHSLGLTDLLRKLEKQADPNDRKGFRQVYQLRIQMGDKIKVLIQQKGIETKAFRGIQFATQYLQ